MAELLNRLREYIPFRRPPLRPSLGMTRNEGQVALVEPNQIRPATQENVLSWLGEQTKPAPAAPPINFGRVEDLGRYMTRVEPQPQPAQEATPAVNTHAIAQQAMAAPSPAQAVAESRPSLPRTVGRIPGLESTGAAPMQYGGRGYATSPRGTVMPDGLTPEQQQNFQAAGARREQLPPGVRQIATITPDSDVPTIQGADYQRLQRIRDARNDYAGRLQNDAIANARTAFAPRPDPLAEKKAAEAAMGGRTIEDVVASMERRTPRGGLRAAEAAARFDDSMAAQERNAGAERQNRLDIATAQGQAAAAGATQEQMQGAFLAGTRARQAATGGSPEEFFGPNAPGEASPPQDYIDLYLQDPTPEKLKKMQARFPGFDPKRYQK